MEDVILVISCHTWQELVRTVSVGDIDVEGQGLAGADAGQLATLKVNPAWLAAHVAALVGAQLLMVRAVPQGEVVLPRLELLDLLLSRETHPA